MLSTACVCVGRLYLNLRIHTAQPTVAHALLLLHRPLRAQALAPKSGHPRFPFTNTQILEAPPLPFSKPIPPLLRCWSVALVALHCQQGRSPADTYGLQDSGPYALPWIDGHTRTQLWFATTFPAWLSLLRSDSWQLFVMWSCC